MAKNEDGTEGSEEEDEEIEQTAEEKAAADAKAKRDKKGKFKKKAPKKKTSTKKKAPPMEEDSEDIDDSDSSSLLEDIAKDLRKEIKTEFGNMDFTHLDLTNEIKTMRSILKGKKGDPQKKKDVSDTEDSDVAPEWIPHESHLAIQMKTNQLKDFYDSKKAIGGDIFKKINTPKIKKGK